MSLPLLCPCPQQTRALTSLNSQAHPMLPFAPQVGNEPLPKASGWVPKDVIRLAQAFKHSNRIKTEWK